MRTPKSSASSGSNALASPVSESGTCSDRSSARTTGEYSQLERSPAIPGYKPALPGPPVQPHLDPPAVAANIVGVSQRIGLRTRSGAASGAPCGAHFGSGTP